MASRRAKITKRAVDALKAPTKGEARLWDTEIKGFLVRAYPTTPSQPEGRKVYALRYRFGVRQRVLTIGEHGAPWTPTDARDMAAGALRRLAVGEDPATTREESKAALTVGELIDAYLADGPKLKEGKRASTWANDKSNLERHIRPLLGRRLAMTVTPEIAGGAIADIEAGRTAARISGAKRRGRIIVKGGPGVARRVRAVASAMWNWGLRSRRIKGANPFAQAGASLAPRRQRFLSHGEAGRVISAVAEMEKSGELGANFADAIRLLMLTGARKSEILGLSWGEVDIERRRLVLPPERTKAGGSTGERNITLSPPALEILVRRRPKKLDPTAFVFPAARGDGHATGLRRAFLAVCKAAGVGGVRLHDLRHTFASLLVGSGASLFLVSRLLGHADARVTERYSHLSTDALDDAAATVGKQLFPGADQGPAEVRALPRAHR